MDAGPSASRPPIPVPAQRAWFHLVSAINATRHGRPDGPVVLYLHGGAYCLHSPRALERIADFVTVHTAPLE